MPKVFQRESFIDEQGLEQSRRVIVDIPSSKELAETLEKLLGRIESLDNEVKLTQAIVGDLSARVKEIDGGGGGNEKPIATAEQNGDLIMGLLNAYVSPVELGGRLTPLSNERELVIATTSVSADKYTYDAALARWYELCSDTAYSGNSRASHAKATLKTDLSIFGKPGKRWQIFCEYIASRNGSNSNIRRAAERALS